MRSWGVSFLLSQKSYVQIEIMKIALGQGFEPKRWRWYIWTVFAKLMFIEPYISPIMPSQLASRRMRRDLMPRDPSNILSAVAFGCIVGGQLHAGKKQKETRQKVRLTFIIWATFTKRTRLLSLFFFATPISIFESQCFL